MLKIKHLSTILFVTFLAIGCKNTSKISNVVIEERIIDEVEVTAPKTDFVRPNYNPSYPRRNDLLHTALDVRFDWAKQHLLGKATLKFKPIDHLPVDGTATGTARIRCHIGVSDPPISMV